MKAEHFVGVVEDVNDPEMIGRVRVRCIGYHTENKASIPTAALPWAVVMSDARSPALAGIGSSNHALLPGSWVVGFFRDGSEAQEPLILGSIPSYSVSEKNPSKGFNDPSGVYPTQLNTKDLPIESRSGANVKAAVTASGISPSLTSKVEPSYPNNIATKTKSGHIIEVDDTPGYERVQITHKSGSFITMMNDGTVAVHSKEDMSFRSAKKVKIEANESVTIQAGTHMSLGSVTYTQLVSDGTMQVTGATSNTITSNGPVVISGSTVDLNP
jgi:hypothetical protein